MAARGQDIATLSKGDASSFREIVRPPLDFPKVQTNYLRTLNSEIPSVVESALGHVTLMRIAYPKQDLRQIQDKLISLASEGATRTIRQKAFIAMQVFAHPLAYRKAIEDRQGSGDGLLEAIAAEM